MKAEEFRETVLRFHGEQGRHGLPWRKTRDPYKILVSEVMLQQTQVERAKPFYESFLRKFPSVRALARAPLPEVLKAWQGLGYNRRAKMLHAAAKEIAKHGMPKTASELERLPGVGAYTAKAVAAFAYGEDSVFIETNIRTAVIHHFFPRRRKVSDAEIEKVLTKCAPKGKTREWARKWNWALMDYGASLKKSGVRVNAKSKHYTKQSRFSGSLRQARGAILKELAKGSATGVRLLGLLGDDRREQLASALRALTAEGFVRHRGTRYSFTS